VPRHSPKKATKPSSIWAYGAGSRVEHYELAGYKKAIGLAQNLKAPEVVALLTQSLSEEQPAEQKLRKIASSLMKTAATTTA
jgi:ferritin-like metal-binding protein YciE